MVKNVNGDPGPHKYDGQPQDVLTRISSTVGERGEVYEQSDQQGEDYGTYLEKHGKYEVLLEEFLVQKTGAALEDGTPGYHVGS